MTYQASRRSFLTGASLAAGAALLGSSPFARRTARAEEGKKPKFLIVLTASGGASLIDGPLALRASESSKASTLNVFPDESVTSFGDIRAVAYRGTGVGNIPYRFDADQGSFVKKYASQMLAITATTTSVNHNVGQRRSITGNEAWRGRTMQEAVALEYGAGRLIPNVHLSTGGDFTARGSDTSLPQSVFGEAVADPLLWPLGLHGSRGIQGGERPDLIAAARKLRDEQLRPESKFSKVFEHADAIKKWRALHARQANWESNDLISKLMIVADSEKYPLGRHGLNSSPMAAKVREKFPDYTKDPFQAQAALAYLLLTQGVSVTVTLGPNFNLVYSGPPKAPGDRGGLEAGELRNSPIGFDFSHTGHRSTQAFMWDRMYRIADGLISLLASTEFENGESYWDRSMIYFATDFGRTKNRPENSNTWGSGHDLNNGFLVLSPLVKGGRVLGGVDPNTCLTYGFDLNTGAPDIGRNTTEAEVFGGVLNTMGVQTSGSGIPDIPAMRRV
jgi:hypothetical protein